MNVLFVCNQNKHRSKTAQEIFKHRFSTKSAGIYRNIVTKNNLQWADLVVVMEDIQRSFIGEKFPTEYLKKRILSLSIPDIYQYNQPELIEILEKRLQTLI